MPKKILGQAQRSVATGLWPVKTTRYELDGPQGRGYN
jgi:hypothetical protein